MKVRDLVDAPLVRTVIQVADLADAGRRRELAESFVLTGEARRAAVSVMGAMARAEGQGFFLIGHFGSGKSHLLTVLHLLAAEPWARAALDPDGGVLPALPGRYLSVAVSLVQHGADERLEEVVLRAVSRCLADATGAGLEPAGGAAFLAEAGQQVAAGHPAALAAFLAEHGLAGAADLFRPARAPLADELFARLGLPYRVGYRRQDAFSQLRERLAAAGYAGLLILVDELSEFLRAKPDGRSFNEDIRFLQFLGEEASRLPCWIVAGLQEAIEQTGEILPEAFQKIQDRYPLQFRLSGGHIRELISRRLLPRRPGAEAALADLHSRLRRAFSGLPFAAAEFLDLYPVHPGTLAFLEELKPLFSQHRGVVDFIHRQVRGDADRGISGLLDEPAGTLLGPDRVFDHFRDRIRALPELAPYSEQVVRFYETQGPVLLADPAEQALALRAVKLLVLAALAGRPRRQTAGEIAHLLLYQLTDWEPEVNYEYVRELLDRLYRGGAYLTLEDGPTPAEDRFGIDLEADAGLALRRRLEYVRKGLLPGDRRAFARALPWLDWPFLPLAGLAQAGGAARSVRWQRTARQGPVILADLAALDAAAVSAAAAADPDFVLCIAHPGDPAATLRHWQEELAPALRRAEGSPAACAWIPAQPAEPELLEETLAHLLVQAELSADPSGAGARLLPLLEARLAALRPRVREVYRTAYFSGRLYSADGEDDPVPEAVGATSFDQVLLRIIDPALQRRYPRHAEIAPRSELLTPQAVQQTLEQLLIPGQVDAASPTVRLVAEGFLAPMGLARKAGKGFRLAVDTGPGRLAGECLAALDQELTPVADVYRHLRRGPFGLSQEAFPLLILSLLAAGLASGQAGGRRVPLGQITPYNFAKLEHLARAELIDAELQPLLAELPWLPSRLTRGPLTYAAQRDAWEATAAWRRTAGEQLAALAGRLPELERHPALAGVDWPRVYADLERVQAVLAEVKVSYGPREGLERLLAAYQGAPYFTRQWERLARLAELAAGPELEQLLSIHGYLADPALDLPDHPRYAGLSACRAELLAGLGREETLLDPGAWAAHRRAFAGFQDDYVAAYLDEHARERGPARFAAHRAVRESGGYQVLAELSRLEAVAADDDAAAVNRRLAGALGLACEAAHAALLRRRPACTCGYRLGGPVEVPSAAEAAAAVQRGLRQYLEELREPRCRRPLSSYLEGLAEVGRRREAERVEALLGVDPATPGVAGRLDGLVTRPVIDLINEALRGRTLMVRRDLDDLYERLLGRTFTPAQLLATVQEWLAGTGPDTYVKVEGLRPALPAEAAAAGGAVAGDGSGSPAVESPLAGFLAAHFPELVSVLRSQGEGALLRAAAALHWAGAHGLPEQAAAELYAAVPGALPGAAPDAGTLRALAAALWGPEPAAGAPGLRTAAAAVLAGAGGDAACWAALQAGLDPAGSLEQWVDAAVREPFLPVLVQDIGRRLAEQLGRAGARQLRRAAEYLERAAGWVRPAAGDDPLARTQRDVLAACAALARVRLIGVQAEQRRGRWPADGDFAAWADLAAGEWATWAAREGALGRAAAQAGLTGAVPLGQLRQQRLGAQAEADAAFAAWCDRNWPAGELPPAPAPARRGDPLTLDRLVLRTAPELARRTGARQSIILWVDALRHDLWQALRPELLAVPGLREVESGTLWAALPTVTDTQVQRLKAAGWRGEFVQPDAGGPPPAGAIVRLNFVDDKLHASKDDYATLCDEVMAQGRRQIVPLLRDAPPGSLLVICSDHGFRENAAFSPARRHDQPRYLHGGCTLAEVLAPWGALLKA